MALLGWRDEGEKGHIAYIKAGKAWTWVWILKFGGFFKTKF